MKKKSPFERVASEHESKTKLVEKLLNMLDRGDEPKEDLQERLTRLANSKLLRIYDTATTVKSRFGTKEKLVDELLKLMNRTKDSDYRTKLLTFTSIRLMGLYRDWQKRAKKAA